MILINLIPFRDAKVRKAIKKQLSFFILSVLFVVSILIYYHICFKQEIVVLSETKALLTNEYNNLQKKVTIIEQKKKQVVNIKQKISTIDGFETFRKKQAVFFNKMPEVLISQTMWLTALEYNEINVKFTGIALNNKMVANFMININKTAFFKEVTLNKTEIIKIGSKLNLKNFEIIGLNRVKQE